MWIIRSAVTAGIFAMTGLPAFAHPVEIATLGRAPLMGASTTPAQLKYNVAQNDAILRQAGDDLGITREQYAEFRSAVESGNANWVTIPRHLDAMTWAKHGHVYVIHDVIIPANQKGIEVDLHHGDRIISLFMPAKCGNLSVIRRNVPHVAAAKIRNFPVPHPNPVVRTGSVAAAPAPVMTTAPLAPAQPMVAAASVVPAAVAHHSLLGLIPLAAIIPVITHTGGGPTTNTSTSTSGPPPCPPGTGP
jgi:hypothetical protein